MSNCIISTPYKLCSRCKKIHPSTLEYFYKRIASLDGLQSICKICKVIKDKRIYQINKVKILQRMKEHYPINRIGLLEYQQQYRKTHKEKLIEYRTSICGHLRSICGAMIDRCNNPKRHNYNRYGGRGIKCLFTSDEFVDYVTNVLQIDPGGLQIDRIDNDGNYEPGNIRFVTAKVNCQNRG